MFYPYPKKDLLTTFSNDEFEFVIKLTACHPLLLQIACKHLYNLKEVANNFLDYSELCDRYTQEAESVYKYYFNKELKNEEVEWIKDYLRFTSEDNHKELQNLQKNSKQRKNMMIRKNLYKLGLVLNKTGPIELAHGTKLYIENNIV